MDKQNNPSNGENWLDPVLGRQESPREIGPDETAVASAGLTHPDDLELEMIMQETKTADWDMSPEAAPAEQTQFFAPQQETNTAPESVKDAFVDTPDDTEGVSAKLEEKQKKKKGYGLFGIPHILSTVIWLVLIVFIGVSLGKTLWLCAADLLALGKEGQAVTIDIAETDDLDSVALKLQEAGMIQYPKLLTAFADLTGKGEHLITGSITFDENTVYDYNALINAMSYSSSALVTVEVMIPEGYSCAQIFALLEEKGVCDAADLEQYAAGGELREYWFLENVPRGHKYCLEGFLFPDTYEFYLDDEPQRVLEKFLDDFEGRFTDRMVEKFSALRNSTGLNLSLYDVIKMASIVEKEKASDLEGYKISSVFYNRLTHASSFPFLNSDATIHYYTEQYCAGQTLTEAQINASPYNTYTQAGLPAGPISNPGLSSLDAALDPESTSFYYFIYDKEAGVHRFSQTIDEHNAWAKKLGLS